MSFMGILGAAMGGAAEAGFKFKSAEAEKRRKEALIKIQEDRQDARSEQEHLNRVALSSMEQNNANTRLDRQIASTEKLAAMKDNDSELYRAAANVLKDEYATDEERAQARSYILKGLGVDGAGSSTAPRVSLTPEMQQEIDRKVEDAVDARKGGFLGFFENEGQFDDAGGSESVFRAQEKARITQEYLSALNPQTQSPVTPTRAIPTEGFVKPGQAVPQTNTQTPGPAATPVATPSEGRALDSIVNFGSTVRNEGVGGIIGNAFNSVFGPSDSEMTPALRSKVSAAIQTLSAGDQLDPATAQEVYPHLPPAFQKKLEQQLR